MSAFSTLATCLLHCCCWDSIYHDPLQPITITVTDGSKLASMKLLSFVDGVCYLLLNGCVLVHLQWPEGSTEPELLSSCVLNLPSDAQETFTDYQLCKGILFVLTSPGFICILFITWHVEQMSSCCLSVCGTLSVSTHSSR